MVKKLLVKGNLMAGLQPHHLKLFKSLFGKA